MGVQLISEHNKKRTQGFSEWVVKNDSKSLTVHGTREDADLALGKLKGVRTAESLDTVAKLVTSLDKIAHEAYTEEPIIQEEVKVVENQAPVREQILSVIDNNGRTVSEIAEAIGRPVPSTRRTLNLLAQQGLIFKTLDSQYRTVRTHGRPMELA
jgi:DNA-binding transcriptional ArsR family regulator